MLETAVLAIGEDHSQGVEDLVEEGLSGWIEAVAMLSLPVSGGGVRGYLTTLDTEGEAGAAGKGRPSVRAYNHHVFKQRVVQITQ